MKRIGVGISYWRTGFALAVGAALAALPWSAGPSSGAFQPLPYTPRYPHEAYAHQLAQQRLQRSADARGWVAAADRALLAPTSVELPFADRVDSPQAGAGYAFAVPAGRRVSVEVAPEGAPGELYVDLFTRAGERVERVGGGLPGAADHRFGIEVVEGGSYVLRVQAPLGVETPLRIEVASEALLAFPVDGVDRRAIWSGFGAERDGGRRAHRGVDIFAQRGTPALAAIDAWVTRVETTRVGGHVVWLQPLFGNLRLYYAHLDEQWVEPGDFVQAGDVLGAVGNTGNAITTPPHLHFGVYVRQPGVRGGARDPADFLR